MGIPFSDSTNKIGLIETLEDLTDTTSAATSSYSLAKKTRDINSALAQFQMLAARASGNQADDTNQTDYPIIKIDLVSGQQDYPVTIDGSATANQVLDINKIELANASGVYSLLPSFDEMGVDFSLVQQASQSGIPTCHYKYANGIFLDKKPNYSYTAGLYLYISRTYVYFLTSDTIKKAGIPDQFHEYLVYRPAYLYCANKGLASATGYLNFLTKMERDIQLFYAGRYRDEKKRAVANVENTK